MHSDDCVYCVDMCRLWFTRFTVEGHCRHTGFQVGNWWDNHMHLAFPESQLLVFQQHLSRTRALCNTFDWSRPERRCWRFTALLRIWASDAHECPWHIIGNDSNDLSIFSTQKTHRSFFPFFSRGFASSGHATGCQCQEQSNLTLSGLQALKCLGFLTRDGQKLEEVDHRRQIYHTFSYSELLISEANDI